MAVPYHKKMGARNMIEFKGRRIIKFNESNIFSRYCAEIADGFCPFLSSAEEQEVLFASYYDLNGNSISDLQENMFYCGIIEIERFRQFRKECLNNRERNLACQNIIFEFSQKFDGLDGKKLFGWPHYLLKVLYTQVGIMLGKFWIKEKDVGRNGLEIPEPPCYFLSIRSVVKSRDSLFFNEDKFLLPALLESKDKGQNVHKFLLPKECDVSSAESMRKHHYYQHVKDWVKREKLLET